MGYREVHEHWLSQWHNVRGIPRGDGGFVELIFVAGLEDGHEGFLRDVDGAD